MSFSDIVIPRPEVLRKDGIEGVIDIENLKDTKKKFIESRPEDFLDLTWPTADVKTVLEHLHQRYNSPERTAGLFLLEGFKGSGKSHLELLIYHLFTNRRSADGWLTKHNLQCTLPDDATVLIQKFTDYPIELEPIWMLVFKKLDATAAADPAKPPNLDQLRQALAGRRLVLIFDELEMGIESINNDHVRRQNITFLQQLSEESNRTENASVTILASVYDTNKEPGDTLKRVPRIDVKFTEPLDRQKVVLHRLFKNAQNIERGKVEAIVQSYVNSWNRVGIRADEKYTENFIRSYPFTPELLDMFLHRVLRHNFQGNRGPLGLLANVIRSTYKNVDVVTAAHIDITDNGIRNRLTDLDPGQPKLNCAQADLRDLQQLPFAGEIVSTTLAASLTSSGTTRGVSELELSRQVIKPGDDYNIYQATLQALDKLGAYFQHSEGSYFFDTQEKPYAKVEYGALKVDPNDAREFALNRWKINVFGDSNAVVYRDSSQTRGALAQMDKNSLRFVLAPKRLEETERSLIYHGTENRNQIILLEPRSDSFNALDHPDLVKWAQLAKSANELQASTNDTDRKRQYEKIASENVRFIDEAFRKAGLNYVLIHVAGDGVQVLQFELEPMVPASNKPEVLTKLQQAVFPRQRFEDHILECLQDDRRRLFIDHTYAEIKNTYKKTLGFPVLTAETILPQAFSQLCKDKKIGLKNNRSRHCGSTPVFSGTEWNDVIVVEPFIEESEFPTLPFGSSSTQEGIPISQTEGTEPDGNGEVITRPSEHIFNIQSTNEASVNLLRQRVAEKLSEYDDPKVHWARFTIFIQQSNAELSSFPSAIRGSMTGVANLHAEIVLERSGQFGKAQIEQLVEQLPSFTTALYKAELRGSSKPVEASTSK
ncbi:MAG TPA: DUF499 domain-containing protein [Bacteroidota bacterium]|nr:DUF499 domain-containing protein [Bacteroidota bacterium]